VNINCCHIYFLEINTVKKIYMLQILISEMDGQQKILGKISLSGIILRLRRNETAAADLEAVGTAEMQVLRMAHQQK
jgi:hypothetical protein